MRRFAGRFKVTFHLILLSSVLLLPSCKDTSEFSPAPKVTESSLCEEHKNILCNPFGGGIKSRKGLIGHIIEGDQEWRSLEPYLEAGYQHPEYVFFSNFNVTARDFQEGFGEGEDYLRDKSGERLIEWFAIEASGNIQLPEDLESGYYHFSTYSDDGIRISVADEVILENNTTHPPTVDCSTKLIYFEKGEKKKYHLNYFQGPRVNIALMTLFKKVDDPQSFQLPAECSIRDLNKHMAAGYKVMEPGWFSLPDDFSP